MLVIGNNALQEKKLDKLTLEYINHHGPMTYISVISKKSCGCNILDHANFPWMKKQKKNSFVVLL